MVEMKNFTTALNRRCKQAMAAAGYDVPRAVSMDLKDPRRPSFQTLVESHTTAECSEEYLRTFDCILYFFPQDEQKPVDELKRMDDAITKALCVPLETDGQELSINESGIQNTIEAGCLVTTVHYESTIDPEDEELGDLPDMEELEDEVELDLNGSEDNMGELDSEEDIE